MGLAGLQRATKTPQRAARGVQVVVVLQGEAVDDLHALLGTLRFGDRDRSAPLDDGRAGQARALTVQRGELGQSRGWSACRDAIAACGT